MRLSEKRYRFSLAISKLMLYLEDLGYHPAYDFIKRCEDCPVGLKNSCHKVSLAADIMLYDKDWSWLNGEHPDTEYVYTLAHAKWLELGGKEYIDGDKNHFSWGYNGII